MVTRMRSNSRQAMIRQQRAEQGLCAFCSQPLGRWEYLCDSCEDRHRERQRHKAAKARRLKVIRAAAAAILRAASVPETIRGQPVCHVCYTRIEGHPRRCESCGAALRRKEARDD